MLAARSSSLSSPPSLLYPSFLPPSPTSSPSPSVPSGRVSCSLITPRPAGHVYTPPPVTNIPLHSMTYTYVFFLVVLLFCFFRCYLSCRPPLYLSLFLPVQCVGRGRRNLLRQAWKRAVLFHPSTRNTRPSLSTCSHRRSRLTRPPSLGLKVRPGFCLSCRGTPAHRHVLTLTNTLTHTQIYHSLTY